MRIELAGSMVLSGPLVLTYGNDQDLDIPPYIEMGYTHFEVICIGAGGGPGGGINTQNTGTLVRNYGGAGGGGGFHRVRGLLEALPAVCPIVVGIGGAVGTEHTSNVGLLTDGGDGGYSSFNGDTCRASGGKGGKAAKSNSVTVTTVADGGEGGVGNRQNPGGGAVGGLAGTPSATGPGIPGTDGEDGTLILDIGQGGGGGAGGVGKYGSGGITCNAATNGGRGAYNPADISVYGPGDVPDDDPNSGADAIIPGAAGGAKASPLNGLPYIYGSSKGERLPGNNGIVVVRLTAE